MAVVAPVHLKCAHDEELGKIRERLLKWYTASMNLTKKQDNVPFFWSVEKDGVVLYGTTTKLA